VRALIRCDSAPIPPDLREQQWDIRESVNHRGLSADLNLRLQNLSHALLASVEERAADLVRLAAYAYAADQLVGRGGPKDVYGTRWRREFTLVLPVSDPTFWSSPQVRTRLCRVLSFVSDDQWTFHFSSATPESRQLPFDPAEGTLLRNPDCVALFSGGADSLCSVVEAVVLNGRKPVLVSHRPAPNIDARQRTLVQELRRRCRAWDFPHISVWVHRRGSEARETTQRTRAFLYASLGAAIASRLGLRDVLLPDNGVVSLNVPTSGQLVGALASRSSHPKFIGLFNDLAKTVLPGSPQIINPLWTRTRAETLEILKSTGMSELLQETVSCARSRGRPAAQPHCGICSQCIDRRFGSVAAGLEEHDLAECYGLDIFSRQLPEGDARTLVLSHISLAREIEKTPRDGLFDLFPQLFDCVLPNDPDPRRTAEALLDLLRRHADQTLRVLEDQVTRHSAELAAGTLPPAGLIALAASAAGADRGDFRHSPDFRSVSCGGEKYSFTARQGQVVQILFEAREKGAPDVGQHYILEELESKAERLRDLFKSSRAWGSLIVRGQGKGTFRLAM